MNKLTRLVLPLALAGTALFGAESVAHAGTWIATGKEYHTLAACQENGPVIMVQYGATAYACDYDEKFGNYEVMVFVN